MCPMLLVPRRMAHNEPWRIDQEALFTGVRGETVRKIPEVPETGPYETLRCLVRPRFRSIRRPNPRSESRSENRFAHRSRDLRPSLGLAGRKQARGARLWLPRARRRLTTP